MTPEITDTLDAFWPHAWRATLPPACFTVGAIKDGARRFAHVRLDAQPPPPAVFGPRAVITTEAQVEAAACSFNAEGADVYFSLAATTPGLGAFHRGTKSQLVALPGFGADFDIAGPGHQSTKLPPDEMTILRDYLCEIPIEPTRIHRTAGGLHVFWLFDEPIVFGTPTTPGHRLEEIQALSTRWQDQFQAIAQGRGEHFDSTADLTRIFRLPGTFNRKISGQPRPVTVAAANGQRVTLDQLRAALKDSKPLSVGLGTASPAGRPAPTIEPWTYEETLRELPKRLRVHAKKRPERAAVVSAFLDGMSYSVGGEHHVVRQQLVSWIAWLSQGRADVTAVCALNELCYLDRDAPPDSYEKFETQLTAALAQAQAKIAGVKAREREIYERLVERMKEKTNNGRRLVP